MNTTIHKGSGGITRQFFLGLGFVLLIANGPSFAQGGSSDHHPTTDQDKIADALRAGPRFITDNATIRDWPSTPEGEYRILRQGTSEWTCLPAVPGYSHDEPGCSMPRSCSG